MKLNKKQKIAAVNSATALLETPYCLKTFNCVDFIRTVYQKAGIKIPLLKPYQNPFELNTSKNGVISPGYIIFLKDRYDYRIERTWTHLCISLTNQKVIHNSRFYGEKVVISKLDFLLKDRYDLVV